jgi:hypothetical protein
MEAADLEGGAWWECLLTELHRNVDTDFHKDQ